MIDTDVDDKQGWFGLGWLVRLAFSSGAVTFGPGLAHWPCGARYQMLASSEQHLTSCGVCATLAVAVRTSRQASCTCKTAEELFMRNALRGGYPDQEQRETATQAWRSSVLLKWASHKSLAELGVVLPDGYERRK